MYVYMYMSYHVIVDCQDYMALHVHKDVYIHVHLCSVDADPVKVCRGYYFSCHDIYFSRVGMEDLVILVWKTS